MATNFCDVCGGVQGPDHKHICAYCGRDAGSRALVYGSDGEEKKFYCDAFCAAGRPGLESLEDGSAGALILAARKIKGDLEKLGIPWSKV